ncbi:hypothetical protein ACGFZK_00370 [Streptomyces sp. NPDC048257]|uniref:hypothetical protein n=1 Tax=Streptomyces sp. NPDC048257 TaxID=3365526 RepID=UPI0037236E24
MHTMTIIVATVTAACTSTAYIRYASTVCRDQHIPLVFHRLAMVPLWVDLVCHPVWFTCAVLLGFTLPLWAAMTLYCAAALLPWELIRRRHNHRAGPLAASAERPLTVR